MAFNTLRVFLVIFQNTFRKMTVAESQLLAKIYVYALRQPYMDESELMGTEEHRQIIINLFYSLFGKANSTE